MARIVVYGAGSIGCYVGLGWLAAGLDVTFIGRRHVGDALAEDGGRIIDGKRKAIVGPNQIRFYEDPAVLAEADVIVLSVKLTDDKQAARDIRQFARAQALVISLQNGVDNAARLASRLPGMTIVEGMVPFNVVRPDHATFRKTSAGQVVIGAHHLVQSLLEKVQHSLVAPAFHADMRAVKWSKLLLNLNNPLNALSGLTLHEELSQRSWRHLLADAQRECLEVMGAEGIEPAKLGPLPPRALPRLLDTPDWFFNQTGLRLQRIDRDARSSMADDFQNGRKTEIDFINGMVADFGRRHGVPCPVNDVVSRLVRQAEAGGQRIYLAVAIREQINQRLEGAAS